MPSKQTAHRLDGRDRSVLRVLYDGRARPLRVRERTGLDNCEVNTVLGRLARQDYIEQVTRGLYQITDSGRVVFDSLGGVETDAE